MRIGANLLLAWGGSAAEIGALMRILLCLSRNMLNVSSHICNSFSCSFVLFADYFGQTMEFECTSDAISVLTKALLPHHQGLSPYLIRIRASLQLAWGGSAAEIGASMRILF
jgi:hypothetical protein